MHRPLPEPARALATPALNRPVPQPSTSVVSEQRAGQLAYQRGRTQRMSDTDALLRSYLGGLRG